jgi:hypothetical protein
MKQLKHGNAIKKINTQHKFQQSTFYEEIENNKIN